MVSLTRRVCGLSAAPLGRATAPTAHALAHPGGGHLPIAMPLASVMRVSAGSGDYPLSGSGVYSRRGFHLCPSCSQKRSLLFSEYLDEHLMLVLPHRQAVQWPARPWRNKPVERS